MIEITKELIDNEAKLIYEMIKASGGSDGVFNYEQTLKGMSASASVKNKIITLTYADGTVSSYAEPIQG